MRKIIFFKDYFMEFYKEQDFNVQEKIEWTLALVRDLKYVPEKYFKHVESSDGLFEIRIQVGSNIYRIFSFFDAGNLVVLINGFRKKSNKTPKKEIVLAKKLMKEYFDEKSKYN